jgi:GTP-binding protein
MTNIHYQNAHFLLSVANLKQLPPDKGSEIAIVGRSNAGKSSVLNCLTRQKALARVSNTPGRTQLINFFEIDAIHRLVDLPGYGFAKVPQSVKQQWAALLDSYLRTRKSLKGLILVMDIRHPLSDIDQKMIQWCKECNLSVHILLNKSDKLTQGKAKQTLAQVKQLIQRYQSPISVQIFSALKKIGLDDLVNTLNCWLAGS